MAVRDAAAPRPRMNQAALANMQEVLGDRLVTSAAQRAHHARGQDSLAACLPDAVAFVESTAEVAAVLSIANRNAVPTVPFGAGTSLEGQVTPVRGGIVPNLSRIDAVVETNAADMDRRVQAGVTRAQLNAPSARPGPVLSGRPRRPMHHRRHVRHPGLRHQRRPLRHHPGERAGVECGAGGWARGPHGGPGPEIGHGV